MTNRRLPLFRLLLFLAGCLLLILGRFLLPVPFAQDWAVDFSWISVFLIYLVWTLPLVLTTFSLRAADVLATSGTIYYGAAAGYTVLSGALIGAVLKGVCPKPLAIAAQLVIAFLFLIRLYLTALSGSHTRAVQNAEQDRSAKLNMIKSFADNIRTAAGANGALSPQVRQRIEKVTSELRYLSPSEDPYARGLEQQMGDLLQTLNAQLSGGVRNEEQILQTLDQLALTYKRRNNTN